MQFINSAAKAWDGLCNTIGTLGSASELLAGKINKELEIQKQTSQLEVRAEVFTKQKMLVESIAQDVSKLSKLRNKDNWAFDQALNVLQGNKIDWNNPNQPSPSQNPPDTLIF